MVTVHFVATIVSPTTETKHGYSLTTKEIDKVTNVNEKINSPY